MGASAPAEFQEGHQDEETPFHAQGIYNQVNQKEISPEWRLHNPGCNKEEEKRRKKEEVERMKRKKKEGGEQGE